MRILKSVYERINNCVTEQYYHGEVKKVTGEVCRVAQVKHEVVHLVPRPAEDVGKCHQSQSLNRVLTSLIPFIVLR